MSNLASQIILSRLATYHELSTILGIEDALNILEVYQVDKYNRYVIERNMKQ